MSYLEQPEVRDALDRANKLRETESFKVSDLVDENGLQYVDLVQEGGGVLGIALVGYVMVLETAGIRFYSLAGTSAGAINTIAMAGIGTLEDEKSGKLLKILQDQNLFDFVDGPTSVQRFLKAYFEKPRYKLLKLGWNAIGLVRHLFGNLGLNPGDAFERWMEQVLQQGNINTTEDLANHRKVLPKGLKLRNGEAYDITPKLAVITSEITTKTKVKFPEMANLYWKDHSAVHPAKYVRASMSIPGFFHPFTLNDIPNDAEAKKRWKDDVRYDGPVPKTVRFVDGGMLSNFPINAFHVKTGNNPTRPTFGVRLSAYRKEESKTDKLGGYAGAMINTMRQSLDFEFLLRNPDYRQLICRVDADEQFNWLDFNMPEEKKKALFALGCAKAITFLEEWHESGGWDAYLEFRKSLL